MLLIYPKAGLDQFEKKKLSLHELLQERNQWGEEKITLDPGNAKKAPMPAQGFRREEGRPVSENDLEGNWALTQATHFALLESDAHEFGFYSFAKETTNQLYKVRGPEAPWRPWMGDRFGGPGGRNQIHRTYEITTGAAAITESLALNRMRNRARRFKDKDGKEEPRDVPIANVRGIDIAEHPWEKMMGDKKPAPEPLAQLVPHDNYYSTSRPSQSSSNRATCSTSGARRWLAPIEVNSRDYRIKQRLEQQLCLKSTGLGASSAPPSSRAWRSPATIRTSAKAPT